MPVAVPSARSNSPYAARLVCRGLPSRIPRSRMRTFLARQMSSAAVDGNRQDPGLQGPDPVPLVQMAHGPHQRFLRHVFRILPVIELPQAKREHLALVLLDEHSQTVGITSQAAFDEFPVVHRVLHLSLEKNTRRRVKRFQRHRASGTGCTTIRKSRPTKVDIYRRFSNVPRRSNSAGKVLSPVKCMRKRVIVRDAPRFANDA